MARDLKYGTVIVERGTIPDDEPVFVLRAQDALAADTIRYYMKRRTISGCTTLAVEAALRNMNAWPVRKMPDDDPLLGADVAGDANPLAAPEAHGDVFAKDAAEAAHDDDEHGEPVG